MQLYYKKILRIYLSLSRAFRQITSTISIDPRNDKNISVSVLGSEEAQSERGGNLSGYITSENDELKHPYKVISI